MTETNNPIANPHIDELVLLPVNDEAAQHFASLRFDNEQQRHASLETWKFLRGRCEENAKREAAYYRSSPNSVSDPRYFGMS